MRPKAAARYALFLILLVLGQEFSVARYSDAPLYRNPPLQQSSSKDRDQPLQQSSSKDHDPPLQQSSSTGYETLRQRFSSMDHESLRQQFSSFGMDHESLRHQFSEQFAKDYGMFGQEEETKELIYSIPANLKPLPGDIDSDYSELTEDDFNIFKPDNKQKDTKDDPAGNENANKKVDIEKKREKEEIEKRVSGFVVVVLAVTLGLTMTELGAELFFKFNKCCKSGYSEACTYRDTFNREKTKMIKLNKDIDAMVLLAKGFLSDIKLTNGEISTVMQKTMAVMETEQEFLVALVPSIIKQFDGKWKEIESALRSKNTTVQAFTIHDVDIQFRSQFDSVQGSMMAMGGVFATLLEGGVYLAWRQWKKNSIAKKLAAANHRPIKDINIEMQKWRQQSISRKSSVSIVDVDYSVRQNNQVKDNVKPTGQGGKWSKGLIRTGQVLTGLILIAGGVMTVLSILKKVQQCKDAVSRAKTDVRKILALNTNLTNTKTNIKNYVTYLDQQGASYIRGQLTKQQFIRFLEQIKQLLDGAGQKSLNNRLAAAAVNTYIQDIRTAPFNRTYNMVKALIVGLGRVEFLYRCYTNKVLLHNYIIQHCKNGDSNLTALFKKATNSWSTIQTRCRDKSGIPYYSFANAVDGVNVTFRNTNISMDCILNSFSKRKEACRLVVVDKDTPAQAAKTMGGGVTEQNVIDFNKNCPPFLLTENNKITICNYRGLNLTNAQIHAAQFPYIQLTKIVAVTCPRP